MKLPCPHCHVEGTPKLQAIPFQGQEIKTGFAVKATCQDCGRYIKFVPQTPEVLALLDEQNAEKKTLL